MLGFFHHKGTHGGLIKVIQPGLYYISRHKTPSDRSYIFCSVNTEVLKCAGAQDNFTRKSILIDFKPS